MPWARARAFSETEVWRQRNDPASSRPGQARNKQKQILVERLWPFEMPPMLRHIGGAESTMLPGDTMPPHCVDNERQVAAPNRGRGQNSELWRRCQSEQLADRAGPGRSVAARWRLET